MRNTFTKFFVVASLTSFLFSCNGFEVIDLENPVCKRTGDGCVKLAWDPVTADNAGNPITAGYKIYWGTQSGNYTNSKDVGRVTEGAVSNLSPGTYYFAVTAYIVGTAQESEKSNEVSSQSVFSQKEMAFSEQAITVY